MTEYYICEGLKSQLLQQGHPQIGKICTCRSGEEALILCDSFKPQIVFTDIKMEGMDGISLIHALSRRLHPVAFVVLSGYDDFHYVKGAFQNGAADYLLKPILSEDLSRILSAIIDDLNGHPQNPDPLRKTLFQLSTSIFQELSCLGAEDTPSPFLLAGLENARIGDRCAAALLVSTSPWPREKQIRLINLLYDSFDRALGCPLAGGKIAILCDSRNRSALGRALSSFVLSQKDSYAASLTDCAPHRPVCRSPAQGAGAFVPAALSWIRTALYGNRCLWQRGVFPKAKAPDDPVHKNACPDFQSDAARRLFPGDRKALASCAAAVLQLF